MDSSCKKVKAAVLVKPGQIELQEFLYPKVTENSAVVKMVMSGICGTDKHLIEGTMAKLGETSLTYPMIPGHENVAKIEEIGDQAAREMEFEGRTLSKGDTISFFPVLLCGKCYWCRNFPYQMMCENLWAYGQMSCEEPPHLLGGWAEYMYLKPGTMAFKIPEEIPPRIAVLADPLANALNIERTMQPFSLIGEGFGVGDTVVIQGAGIVGIMAAVVARMLGATKVIMIGAPEHRLRTAREFGVDYTINIDQIRDVGNRVKQVLELTEGRGGDLVVECAGMPGAIPEGLEIVRKNGVYLEMGCVANAGQISIDPARITQKNLHVIGVLGYPYRLYGRSLKLLKDFSRIFPFEKLVTHEFKLEEVNEAVGAAFGLKGMKVVIVP